MFSQDFYGKKTSAGTSLFHWLTHRNDVNDCVKGSNQCFCQCADRHAGGVPLTDDVFSL